MNTDHEAAMAGVATVGCLLQLALVPLALAARAARLLVRTVLGLFTNPIGWALLAFIGIGIALVASGAAKTLGVLLIIVCFGLALLFSLVVDSRQRRAMYLAVDASIAAEYGADSLAVLLLKRAEQLSGRQLIGSFPHGRNDSGSVDLLADSVGYQSFAEMIGFGTQSRSTSQWDIELRLSEGSIAGYQLETRPVVAGDELAALLRGVAEHWPELEITGIAVGTGITLFVSANGPSGDASGSVSVITSTLQEDSLTLSYKDTQSSFRYPDCFISLERPWHPARDASRAPAYKRRGSLTARPPPWL
ncbi:hypothetical protein [Candidatus Poriferisodalis sp.]|uniref:hypothetical protein n=1 Tax=Candidatus Poriferisodalis sp. TaxID=3101277 RepID=UPI003AF8E571